MKKLLIAAAVTMLSVSAVHAQTATGPNAFNVAINLTSQCQVNVPTTSTLTFNYTSFQTSNADDNFGFNVKCTTSLPYTLSFDAGAMTDPTTGLTYSLSFAGYGGSATTGPTPGTGADTPWTVYGRINSGQSGSCATATCSSTTARTVLVTY